jgi:protoporphyrinogen/coproporphyrinogen III oxidase
MKSVAVVGGGITGLTAAFRLQRKNLPVTVYETGDRIGGMLQSVRRDGYLAEFGPNTILETSPQIAELVNDLGLAPRRLYSDPLANNRYLVRSGRLVKMPDSPLGFMKTPLFSRAAKLRLLLEPFVSRSDAAKEQSVAEFVERRLGTEFLDRAVDALVGGIYAGDPRKLSVREAFPKMFALEQKYGSLIKGQIFGARERKRRAEVAKPNAKKFSFDEGLHVLPKTLETKLRGRIRLRSPVTRLRSVGDDWMVTSADGSTATHSAIIYAGTALGLARINIEGRGRINIATFAEIHYPPVTSVVLGFRRKDIAHPLDGFGMLIPKGEGFRILGTIFSSSLFPNRAPSDCVTLTSYLGGARAPKLAQLPAESVFEITCQDLRALLGVSGQPTFKHHVLFPRAIPQYELGYGRFKKSLTAIENSAAGIFFAGQYRDGVSVSDCIMSGHSAANRVAEYLRQGAQGRNLRLPAFDVLATV